MHASTKKYKFFKFAERVARIDLDIFRGNSKYRQRSLEQAQENDDPESMFSYFGEELKRLRTSSEVNVSTEWKTLEKNISRNSSTVPLLLYHQKSIVKHLLVSLEYARENPASTTTFARGIHRLIISLAKDLRQEFVTVSFSTVLHALIKSVALPSGLNQHGQREGNDWADAEALESVFTTIAYLFKFLMRHLVDNFDLVFRAFIELFLSKRKYIRQLSAESFAYFLRHIPSAEQEKSITSMVSLSLSSILDPSVCEGERLAKIEKKRRRAIAQLKQDRLTASTANEGLFADSEGRTMADQYSNLSGDPIAPEDPSEDDDIKIVVEELDEDAHPSLLQFIPTSQDPQSAIAKSDRLQHALSQIFFHVFKGLKRGFHSSLPILLPYLLKCCVFTSDHVSASFTLSTSKDLLMQLSRWANPTALCNLAQIVKQFIEKNYSSQPQHQEHLLQQYQVVVELSQPQASNELAKLSLDLLQATLAIIEAPESLSQPNTQNAASSNSTSKGLSVAWQDLLKLTCQRWPEVSFASLLKPKSQQISKTIQLSNLLHLSTPDSFFPLLVHLSQYLPGLWVTTFITTVLSLVKREVESASELASVSLKALADILELTRASPLPLSSSLSIVQTGGQWSLDATIRSTSLDSSMSKVIATLAFKTLLPSLDVDARVKSSFDFQISSLLKSARLSILTFARLVSLIELDSNQILLINQLASQLAEFLSSTSASSNILLAISSLLDCIACHASTISRHQTEDQVIRHLSRILSILSSSNLFTQPYTHALTYVMFSVARLISLFTTLDGSVLFQSLDPIDSTVSQSKKKTTSSNFTRRMDLNKFDSIITQLQSSSRPLRLSILAWLKALVNSSASRVLHTEDQKSDLWFVNPELLDALGDFESSSLSIGDFRQCEGKLNRVADIMITHAATGVTGTHDLRVVAYFSLGVLRIRYRNYWNVVKKLLKYIGDQDYSLLWNVMHPHLLREIRVVTSWKSLALSSTNEEIDNSDKSNEESTDLKDFPTHPLDTIESHHSSSAKINEMDPLFERITSLNSLVTPESIYVDSLWNCFGELTTYFYKFNEQFIPPILETIHVDLLSQSPIPFVYVETVQSVHFKHVARVLNFLSKFKMISGMSHVNQIINFLMVSLSLGRSNISAQALTVLFKTREYSTLRNYEQVFADMLSPSTGMEVLLHWNIVPLHLRGDAETNKEVDRNSLADRYPVISDTTRPEVIEMLFRVLLPLFIKGHSFEKTTRQSISPFQSRVLDFFSRMTHSEVEQLYEIILREHSLLLELALSSTPHPLLKKSIFAAILNFVELQKAMTTRMASMINLQRITSLLQFNLRVIKSVSAATNRDDQSVPAISFNPSLMKLRKSTLEMNNNFLKRFPSLPLTRDDWNFQLNLVIEECAALLEKKSIHDASVSLESLPASIMNWLAIVTSSFEQAQMLKSKRGQKCLKLMLEFISHTIHSKTKSSQAENAIALLCNLVSLMPSENSETESIDLVTNNLSTLLLVLERRLFSIPTSTATAHVKGTEKLDANTKPARKLPLKTFSDDISMQLLNILRRLSSFASSLSVHQANKMLQLILPYIKSPKLSSHIKHPLIVTYGHLARFGSDLDIYVAPLASLLETLSDVNCRVALSETLSLIFSNSSEFSPLTQLVLDLESYSTLMIGEKDYERRSNAFSQIISSLQSDSQSRYSLRDEDMSIRSHSSTTIIKLLHAIHNQYVDEELLHHHVIPAIRKRLASANKNSQEESVTLLGHLIRIFPNLYSDLKQLTSLRDNSRDDDFFYNLNHLQLYRRSQALTLLQNETIVFSPKTIKDILAPLLWHMIVTLPGSEHQLVDSCAHALASFSRNLPWKHYTQILLQCAKALRNKLNLEKRLIHVLTVLFTVIDKYVFSTQPLQSPDDVNEDSDGESEEEEHGEEGHALASATSMPASSNPALSSKKDLKEVKITLVSSINADHLDYDQDDSEDQAGQKINKSVMEFLRNRFIAPLLALVKVRQSTPGQSLPPALALIQLLKTFPKKYMMLHFPALLHEVVGLLCSRVQLVRNSARETLVKFCHTLGLENILAELLHELSATLNSGYKLHVLGYTVHLIFYHLVNDVLKDSNRLDALQNSLHDALPDIMKILVQDYLLLDEKKNVDKIAKSMKEAGKSRAPITMSVLSKAIRLSDFDTVVNSIRLRILTTVNATKLQRLNLLLKSVSAGLMKNPKFSTADVLPLLYKLMHENLPPKNLSNIKLSSSSSTSTARDVDNNFKNPDLNLNTQSGVISKENEDLTSPKGLIYGKSNQIMVQKVKRRDSSRNRFERDHEQTLRDEELASDDRVTSPAGDGTNHYLLPICPNTNINDLNSDLLLMADVLTVVIKRQRALSFDVALLTPLRPWFPLLLQSLDHRESAIVISSLKCITGLLKFSQLDSIIDSELLSDLSAAIFNLTKSNGFDSAIGMHCLKLYVVLIRDHHTLLTLDDSQINYLLDLIKVCLLDSSVGVDASSFDLNPSASHPQANSTDRIRLSLQLFKAFVERRYLQPVVYDLIGLVFPLILQSRIASHRATSASTFTTFLISYPLGEKRLRKHLEWIVANLEYTHASGRLSILELITSILTKFPPEVIEEKSSFFFFPLFLTLANDDEPNCRLLSSKAISILFGRISATAKAQLLAFVSEWLATPITCEANILTIAAALQVFGVVSEVCNDILSSAHETWLSRIHTAISSAMTNPLQEFALWKVIYQGFTSYERFATANPKIFQSKVFDQIWSSVSQCVLHEHNWVKLSAARLLGRYFTVFEEKGGLEVKITESALKQQRKNHRSEQSNYPHLDSEWILQKNVAFSLMQDLKEQLNSEMLTLEHGQQVVKNIIFIIRLYFSPNAPPTTTNSVTEPHEEQELNDTFENSDDQEESLATNHKQVAVALPKPDETNKHQLAASDDPIHWILRRLSFLARKCAQSNHILLKVLLQFFTVVATTVIPAKIIKAFLPPILHTLYRVSIQDAGKSQQEFDENIKFAEQALKLIESKVDSEVYFPALETVRRSVASKRLKRKRDSAVEAFTNPAVRAQKRMKHNRKKTETRKRKNQHYNDNKMPLKVRRTSSNASASSARR